MPGKLGCVIVAVDGGEESMARLVMGSRQYQVPDSCSPGSIVILHASPHSIPEAFPSVDPGAAELEAPAFLQVIEAHQKRITETILYQAPGICTGKNGITEVLIGDPKDKICEAVANFRFDFLVMGYRAFGPIKWMFLGSVSNYCLIHPQCPVFIAKNKNNSS